MPNKKALTLIELLVALSIFSIVMLSVYSTFHTGILAYRKIDSISSLYQKARITLERIAQDLENSFPYSSQDSEFIGGAQGLSFFCLASHYSNLGSQPRVYKVEYRLNDGQLERLLYSLYDENEIVYKSSLSKIQGLQFSYSFAKDDEPFYAWQDSWQEKDNIPQGVKIDLSITDPRTKQTIKFSKIIFIPQGALVESKL